MNFLNRCAHCQHWERNHPNHELELGHCDLIDSWGNSDLIRVHGDDAWVETREDFGCILWEPREDSTHANSGT